MEIFFCQDNKLKSLKVCPKIIGGNFDCRYNNLKSLEGSPKEVGGHFLCYGNSKIFTKEEVLSVCDVKGRVYVKLPWIRSKKITL